MAPKVWNGDVVKCVAVLRSLFGKSGLEQLALHAATFRHHSGVAITAKRHNIEKFARDSIAASGSSLRCCGRR